MKILVIGSGGREHVLCWLLGSSSLVNQIFCAPGNAGISNDGLCVDIDPMNFDKITDFCKSNNIDLVVVGPEAPLVAGIVDHLESAGIACFGPNAEAAKLEGSKIFMKELCDSHNIPTAKWGKFDNFESAKNYIELNGAPIVVKADGLAAGKGVIVATNTKEAIKAAESMFNGAFGSAGSTVLIEECLVGEEASFFAIVDGKNVLPLATAQDHKRIGEKDTGLNTGGMGAYSPAPILSESLCITVQEQIINPLIQGLAMKGIEFKGVFYAGLMITKNGPKLLEVNVRFGDPECQAVLPRLKSDLLPALLASRDGELKNVSLQWREESAICVVMSSKGYPEKYTTGNVIKGLENAADNETIIFHAGTKLQGPDIVSDGGRVLGISALGSSLEIAQKRAYNTINKIDWPQGYYRKDIGWRAINN